MSTAIVPVADLERMASAVAASKLFGMQTKEQAMALMLIAQAEGLHPATAARDYHIIQGRAAMKADAMLARYLASGGKVEWHEHTDERVSATFAHPAGGALRVDWDMPRAKKAGLGGKDMWAKYPRQMLRARVISEGIRATNPGIAIGIYTPEEVHDMDDKPRRERRTPEVRDMGDAEVVESEPADVQDEPNASPPQQLQDRGASTSSSSPVAADGEAPLITADQAIHLEDRCREVGIAVAKFCKAANVERISQLRADRYDGALDWLSKREAA